MRRVVRQVRSLRFDFGHRRRQLEWQFPFWPSYTRNHVEQRRIADAKIGD
jgi:hypothetical protein